MSQDHVQQLIRENAELKARVAELTRELGRAEAVSQLAAGVVHDVRNALQVILVEAENLRDSLRDASQRDLANTILVAGNHAVSVARDVLGVVRKQTARTSFVNGAQLLSEFKRLIQRVASQSLVCVFAADSNAWSVEVDRPQLEAALLNLSANARDAMPQGGELRVSARNIPRGMPLPAELPAGDYVGFCVEDSGVGMAAAVLARATEAFFTTKPGDRGTGLGLAMVHAFAQHAGGALRIDSTVGYGTRVEILLPRALPPGALLGVHPERQRAKLQRLQRRMRTTWLRQVLDGWSAACPSDGLPPPSAAEAGLVEHIDCSLVLGLELGATPPRFRLLRMGDALMSQLGQTALGELPLAGSTALGSLGAAYRRALHSSFPSYEYVRYAFGDGSPAEFERLILPAAADGKTVSHLIGVVVLSTNLRVAN
jgi:nitrogen-specific signal transduction histidine kinase